MQQDSNPYAPPQSKSAEPASSGILAGRMERLIAAIIDGVIGLAILWPLMYVGGYWSHMMNAAMRGERPNLSTQLLWAAIALVMFLLVQSYPLHKSAQTWGKRVLRIRIVDLNGRQPSLLHLVVFRYLPINVVNQIPILNIIAHLSNALLIFRADRRCGHDHIAKTRVVKA